MIRSLNITQLVLLESNVDVYYAFLKSKSKASTKREAKKHLTFNSRINQRIFLKEKQLSSTLQKTKGRRKEKSKGTKDP